MNGKVGFRIHEEWARPDKALLESFGEASPAQVGDCMHRLGAMDTGLRAMWRSPRVIGPAVTVWARSGDNLMFHKGIAMCQPGDILVVNTQGNLSNSGFGELMASAAVKVGIGAVIVDGVVRDVLALEALGLPVYARGTCPGGCDKDGPGEVGGTIACGGVAVRAGDIVIADADGITVVPLADARSVAGLAQEQLARESKRLAEIADGVLVRPEIDEALRRRGIIA